MVTSSLSSAVLRFIDLIDSMASNDARMQSGSKVCSLAGPLMRHSSVEDAEAVLSFAFQVIREFAFIALPRRKFGTRMIVLAVKKRASFSIQDIEPGHHHARNPVACLGIGMRIGSRLT